MIKWDKKVTVLAVTVLLTALVTVLRVTLVPWLQNGENVLYSYAVVAAIVIGLLVVLLLLRSMQPQLQVLPKASGKWFNPICFVSMVVGVCVLLSTAFDAYQYFANGIAPPPAQTVGTGLDRLALWLSFACGLLAGVYLIRLGLGCFITGEQTVGTMPLLALTPTFWVWMRLARYEVSYASAVEVHRSFYDFAMLLAAMLFLFAFARQMTGVEPKTPYLTVFFALCTLFFTVSGWLTKMLFLFLGDGDAYRAGQLVGVADFAIGILAGMFALQWLFSKPPVQYTTFANTVLDIDGEPLNEVPAPAQESALEDILRSFSSDDTE